MKKLVSFLLRIDNMSRIMVFVSMALFLVVPSLILFYLDEGNQTTDIVIRCIVLIGIILGPGLIALVRPIRTTLLYFIELLFTLIVEFFEFNPTDILDGVNFAALFWLEVIFSVIAICVNAVMLKKYMGRKKKVIQATKEDTNEDTVFDFLNATSSNDKIEEDLENIMEEKEKLKMRAAKKMKFSRALRIFSFAFSYITLLVYFIDVIQKTDPFGTMYHLLLLSIILIPLVFLCSLKYPRDFKYLYFYDTAFFLTLSLICSSELHLKPIFLIISLVVLILSLILTLIVEGRTWMGSSSD